MPKLKKQNFTKLSQLGVCNTSYDIRKDGISQSMIQKYLDCRTAFLYHIHGFTNDIISKRTIFGQAVHVLLEKLYLSGDIDLVLKSSQKLWNKFLRENSQYTGVDAQSKQDSIDIAKIMVKYYYKTHKTEIDKGLVQHIEREFRYDYYDYPLLLKIDGLLQKSANYSFVLDHKTSSRMIEDNLMLKLSFDFQMKFYPFVLRLCGYDVSGSIYNVIRKPLLRKRSKETHKNYLDRIDDDVKNRSEFYFIRFPIEFTKKEFREFGVELLNILIEIENFMDQELPIVKNTGSCLTFSQCMYLESCGKNSLLSLTKRKKFFSELKKVSTK